MNLMRMRTLKKNKGGPGDGTSGGVARALYLDDAPRGRFQPELCFTFRYLASLKRERNVGP